MAEKKKSKSSRIAVWIIIGLLMFGMIGFGASGLSGTSRTVGSVGDKNIGVDLYVQALRTETAAFEQQIGRPLTGPEILAAGLDQRALNRAVTQRALDNHASDLGVSMGDERVLEQIRAIPSFAGLGGAFDETAYRNVLRSNNLNTRDFEESIRETAARDILRNAVTQAINVSPTHSETLASFLLEQRDFEWAKVDQALMTTGVPVATDADLQTYFDENQDQFRTPTIKDIQYIWVQPEMILDDVLVTETDIQELYDERSEQYQLAERRIVDRLIMTDTASAQAGVDAVNDGSSTFEALVADRGLELTNVELGIVEQIDLGMAGEQVFAVTETGTFGPFETDLGPAIFRVNAILNAQITPLAEIADELRAELATIQAVERINEDTDAIDDLLAAGATLEEVAAETIMQLGQIDWHLGETGAIAANAEFRDAAQSVSVDDFPELASLSDGGLFAIALQEVREPTVPEFSSVKSDVKTAWDSAALLTSLNEFSAGLADQWRTVDGASLGLTAISEAATTRSDFVDGAPPSLVTTAFEMIVGETRVLDDGRDVYIIKLLGSEDADLSSEEAQSLTGLMSAQLDIQINGDVFEAYAEAVRQSTDVNVNVQMVQGVLASVTTGR